METACVWCCEMNDIVGTKLTHTLCESVNPTSESEPRERRPNAGKAGRGALQS